MKLYGSVVKVMSLCVVAAGIAGAAPAVNEAAINEAMPDEAPGGKAGGRKFLFFKKPERKVLVFTLCKGFRHGSIPTVTRAIEIMGEKTGAFTATQSDDMAVFTEETLAQYDAIILNNTTKLPFKDNEEARKALMGFVKEGKGLVGIHAASDNFYDWPEAAEMIGGQFDGHPWTAGGTWAIKNEEPKHPLNKSFNGEGFKIKDEVYHNRAVLEHMLSGIQYVMGDLKVPDAPSNKK